MFLGCTLCIEREWYKGQVLASTGELQLNYFNAQVVCWAPGSGRDSAPLIMWKLIPVRIEPRSPNEAAGQEISPSYEGDRTGQSSTRTQHAESERDDFGTIVTEVTTVTTVTTTRKKYRVEDA